MFGYNYVLESNSLATGESTRKYVLQAEILMRSRALQTFLFSQCEWFTLLEWPEVNLKQQYSLNSFFIQLFLESQKLKSLLISLLKLSSSQRLKINRVTSDYCNISNPHGFRWTWLRTVLPGILKGNKRVRPLKMKFNVSQCLLSVGKPAESLRFGFQMRLPSD